MVVYPPGAPLDPPEPPKAVQPFVAHLGDALDAVNLALNAGHEQVFAFTPRLL